MYINHPSFNFEKLNQSTYKNQHLPQFIWKAKKHLMNFTNTNYTKFKQKFDEERSQIQNDKHLKNFNYSNAKIKVLGIGGAGNNVLETYLNKNKLYNPNIEFIAINTEEAPLRNLSKRCSTLLLGQRGLGSGSDPELAGQLAQEKMIEIQSLVSDADLVVLIAGIGKGTGTGSTPIIAKIIKSLNIPILSLIFYPHTANSSEEKVKQFNKSLDSIRFFSNSYSIFNNNYFYDDHLTQIQSFAQANNFLANGLKSVLNLASHIYNEIDSCDFITFVKKRNRLSFFNLDANLEEINQLETNLNKMLEIYQIKKNNICRFMITSDNGVVKAATNQIAKAITTGLQNFFVNQKSLDIVWGSHQTNSNKTTLNIIMSEICYFNQPIESQETSTITEPSLTSQNVENARMVITSVNHSNRIDIGNNQFVNSPSNTNRSSRHKINLNVQKSTNDVLLQSITKMMCRETSKINTRNNKVH